MNRLQSTSLTTLALASLTVATAGSVVATENAPDAPQAATATAPAAADTFRVDPAHAHVGFAVRHLAIATVRGVFQEVRGTLVLDRENPTRSSVQVRIATASLNTRNERRDTDLKENFLKVSEFPEIVFESKRVVQSPDGWHAIGPLTINGVTREVDIAFTPVGPVAAPGGLERIGIEGNLVIDRRDFGITLSRIAETGAIVVGNDVRIELDVEFGRRTAPASP